MARKATKGRVRARAPERKSAAIRKRAKGVSDTSLVDAVDAWEALDVEAQRTLTFEIARARGDELRLAYPALVGVASGFRTRGRWGQSGDRRTVESEPCVVFMVKRKWVKKPKSASARRKELPKYLHAFCDGRDGKKTVRRACVVPVDVVEAGDHVGTLRSGRAERSRVYDDAEPPGRESEFGSIAAIVRSSQLDERFVLTCHHFGAMSRAYNGVPVAIASMFLDGKDGEGKYAGLSGYLGQIVEPPAYSLDGALMRPRTEKMDLVRRALGSERPTTPWSSLWNPPKVVRVVVSDRRSPIEARFAIRHQDFEGLEYFTDGRRQPRHVEMWEYDVVGRPSTREGDSGCAVLSDDYEYFAGMHLGGVNESGRIFVLPAYLCLEASSYGLAGTLSLRS